MDYSKNRTGDLVLLLIVGSLVYTLFWSSNNIRGMSYFSSLHNNHQSSLLNQSTKITVASTPKDELEIALEKVSKGNNKTLIITTVNKAYVEGEKTMLSLFLESFWLGENTRSLVDNLLLVTVDQVAFEKCKFLRLNCYKLGTEEGGDFAEEKTFMTKDFISMMWRRTSFLGDVLKRGYSFIFTDTDVMWLNNPFLRLSKDEDLDLQISCDGYNGDPWSRQNSLNTGFYLVRSNDKTIALFEKWYEAKDDPQYFGQKEQDVLKTLLNETASPSIVELGLKVRFLDHLYFSGFCGDSKDMNVVCTVHANCCRHIKAKVKDLRVVLRDWKKFKMNPIINGTRTTIPWSPHEGCNRSWEY